MAEGLAQGRGADGSCLQGVQDHLTPYGLRSIPPPSRPSALLLSRTGVAAGGMG